MIPAHDRRFRLTARARRGVTAAVVTGIVLSAIVGFLLLMAVVKVPCATPPQDLRGLRECWSEENAQAAVLL